MSEAPEVYDAVELRRRIVVAFTPGELRELAEQLGVGGSIAWERGSQEAARELVKQCERYAGLAALVAKLREARPLVEWPAPTAAPADPAASAFPQAAPPAPLAPLAPSPPADAAPPAPTAFAPAVFPQAPPLAPLPGSLSGDAAPPFAAAPPPFSAPSPFAAAPPPSAAALPRAGGTIVDPFAPAAPPPPAVAPSSSAAPSPLWPGTAAPPSPSPPRGVDPRILVAVAGLMLLAAIIAYLAGRASNAAPAVAGSPAGADAAATRRTDGPAALAADVIARSVANLARVCEQKPGDSDLVFRRIFERCGRAPLPTRPYSPPLPTPAEPSAAADEPAAPTPATGRPRRPRAGGDAPAAPAGDAQAPKGCMGACSADHRACSTRCGPEPTEGASDEGYRRCLGRCLTDASRCRLACR